MRFFYKVCGVLNGSVVVFTMCESFKCVRVFECVRWFECVRGF